MCRIVRILNLSLPVPEFRVGMVTYETRVSRNMCNWRDLYFIVLNFTTHLIHYINSVAFNKLFTRDSKSDLKFGEHPSLPRLS